MNHQHLLELTGVRILCPSHDWRIRSHFHKVPKKYQGSLKSEHTGTQEFNCLIPLLTCSYLACSLLPSYPFYQTLPQCHLRLTSCRACMFLFLLNSRLQLFTAVLVEDARMRLCALVLPFKSLFLHVTQSPTHFQIHLPHPRSVLEPASVLSHPKSWISW